MASTREAEIVFAQKLASNEKPVRSRALVKLRKYISARSETAGVCCVSGFREEELLKIWKGLFYCMWMQDKPLLQEELSTKISRLLHSFRTLDSQFLYLKTFLQTMKREWNGIDRLRMDKYFQLVRFVFREVFEMLKRQQWESRLVSEFLQLFSAQLLHSSSAAPAGFLLHALDLYLTELALVGSAELTAEQNQTFIEPFFKTMAKTKEYDMLKAIGSNIFNTIVDQVPYAIEDLQREISESAELDSSEEPENQQDTGETKTEALSESSQKTQDCDEEEYLLSDGMDASDDDTCGPVLQFDYGAIADRLFEGASHSNIQSFNRSKIYKFVKIFRDLSEGVFPQDEVEKVSTDEDDDDDHNGRRKRKRRKQKNKDKKGEESLKKSKGQSESVAASDDTDISKDTQPKKKSKKKKKSGLKCVEGQQTEESSGQETQDATGLTEEKLESDAELPQCDSENKHRAHESPCSEPALKQMKKQRRKRTASRKTCEKAEEADHCSEMGISVTSAEVVTPVPPKKKAKGATVSAIAAVDVSAAAAPQKKLKSASSDEQTQADSQKTQGSAKASRKTPVKKKVQEDVVSDVPEPETNGDAHQEETVLTEDSQQPAGRLRAKKSKQTSAAVQIKPGRKRRVKPSQVNGHADQTSVKRPKIISEAEEPSVPVTKDQMKAREFVLRQKKAPSPIFCKAAGYSTRMASKKVLPASKSEMKKVTFGLKNNKTMEFRKMDQSSLLSPARQSRVAFDPKRTPQSGVLKSPGSSPAVMKRAMAADFF
ncbi:ribosomal RNA processing protein 1 homolog A isoform X2 [Sinocyclocheilus anshuiensis]|uniref:ribosomal RNA processing protein 1 homolog A isoform X2 n=1 Tax=Sinocyclocheilus anshuiensis TaxID=1608454 RepID=UPI0007B9FFDB|nr:PREDICTED: ribosomal RNA processing protein 1 homolog A-like isoform X2 [Sinocyclocheilus anshuiensis]